MVETFLRDMTLLVAQVHATLMHLNDSFELRLDDKALHFIVMAVLGMLLFFVVHFVFKRLARISISVLSFIYVFTVMTVLGFAIEIGQRITGTGSMEFADIVFGIVGFLLMYLVYALILLLLKLLRKLLGK